ncbi:hypothetical protein LIPSTDRAFT_105012 [Lipomyces starkeyi NRRL Y-11557]|uniref:Uncharacterized protein n=1 Tax=Lipomyces starkeyi NRRL Y-11557 TaxID=675824 RepID=A0A1E3Q3W1_LIPST|nr:hypothetical protein LIPSTDRAFT_105012 [Lipomyces starkeyi NRRL Y-11557]
MAGHFRDFRHVQVDNQYNSNPYEIPEITNPARNNKTTFVKKPDYERIEKSNTRGKTLGGSSC